MLIDKEDKKSIIKDIKKREKINLSGYKIVAQIELSIDSDIKGISEEIVQTIRNYKYEKGTYVVYTSFFSNPRFLIFELESAKKINSIST